MALKKDMIERIKQLRGTKEERFEQVKEILSELDWYDLDGETCLSAYRLCNIE